jgi:hypothetical protein
MEVVLDQVIQVADSMVVIQILVHQIQVLQDLPVVEVLEDNI